MSCDAYKDLMMAYMDGELSTEHKQRLQDHVAGCDACRDELAELTELKKIADEIRLVEPEDRMWEQYWSSVYNRGERNVGWIVVSVAAIVLLAIGGYTAIDELIEDASIGLFTKVALFALIGGLAILFVSVVRERLFFHKKDRYKDVRR